MRSNRRSRLIKKSNDKPPEISSLAKEAKVVKVPFLK